MEVRFEVEGGFVADGSRAGMAAAQRALDEQSRHREPVRRDTPKPWRTKAERKAWKRAIGRRR